MAKKRRKRSKDADVTLSMDEIEAKMEELREDDAYAKMDDDRLRAIAIEAIFEEIDDED